MVGRIASRATKRADIEKTLGRGLWILETIVTAAPLLGLLGTITGMMQSFKVIGGVGPGRADASDGRAWRRR